MICMSGFDAKRGWIAAVARLDHDVVFDYARSGYIIGASMRSTMADHCISKDLGYLE